MPAGFNPREMQDVFPDSDVDYGYRAVRSKIDDLLDIAVGQFRPDVIVREPTDLAPIIAGEVLGAVNVIFGVARFIPPSSWEILGADRVMTRLRADFHLPDDPELACMYRDLYLTILPKAMEVYEPLPVPAVQPIRYVTWDGDTRRWPPLAPTGVGERPRVLMTLGTVYNYNTELFSRFITALAEEDVDVICTLGSGSDPALTENAPGNVHFETYRPHSSILPGCRVMLCHGGFNTVMGSLMAGVPMVCVPLGSDQEYNATLCQRKGYAIALRDEEATPERIRAAVRQVLTEPSYTDKVKAFQLRMERRPPLLRAVRRIEGLVAARPMVGRSSISSP
jgi:UDP:flavonoid glycosyltransferase YjiC (YdhE family)